jgi:hypothetical protein
MLYLKYSGALQSKEMLAQLTEEFVDICRISGWEYSVIKENFQTMTMRPYSGQASQMREADMVETHTLSSSEVFLEGIAIRIRPDCDPIRFTFDKSCRLATIDFLATDTTGMHKKLTVKKYEFLYYPYVKLYTAGAEYHAQVVKLLDYIKKRYVKDLEVIDSSFYWETRDEEMLKVKIWKSSIKQKSV